MAVEKIKKLLVIAYSDHREALLESLHKLGVVQIEDIRGNNTSSVSAKSSNESANVSPEKDADDFDWEKLKPPLLPERRTIEKAYETILSAIEFLHQYIPKRSGFELLREGPETVTAEEEKHILEGFNYEKIVEGVKELEGHIKSFHAKRLTLHTRRGYLLPWVGIGVPMDKFRQTEHTRILALSIPITCVDACRKAAEEAISELYTVKVGETKHSKNIVIIYHRDSEEAVQEIMEDFEVHPAVFPHVNLTPAEMIGKIEAEISAITEKTRRIEARLKEMRDALLKLKVVADHLDNRLERKRAQELCGETHSTFILRGWVPEKKIQHLQKTLQRIAPEVDITLTDPEPDEEVPVILQNRRIIRPFETVVDIYGKPDYREFDPTPSVALFFFIGFGYCLTDAGYGAVLALLFGFAALKLKLAPGVKKFCTLMALAGLSAIVLGSLTGGWFGNLFTDKTFPTYKLGIAPVIKKVQRVDPLGSGIMVFLGAALAIGLFQLVWGVCIKFMGNIVKGRVLDALCGQFPWLLFVAGIVVVVFSREVGMVMCIAGLALMLFFSGRGNKNIIMRLTSGLWTIYGALTGLLSDVLSYSRLFALGLATGIMATVINIIAFILWPIPVVGWLLTIIMLVVAHPLNIAINTLGAFIHTARLQFVEFFPKFYEDGGHKFEPFAIRHKFVAVKETKA